MEVSMDLIDIKQVKILLGSAQNCLLGVSGGIDSMVLLHWFASNRKTLGKNFTVMYVDHGIHPESPNWGKFVADECAKYNMPVICEKVTLPSDNHNLEYAARQARYKAFCQRGADHLILAHHANDQFECFMLKLFRGSGVKGLKAMNDLTNCWYDNRTTIVRPMLNITRRQIEAYAAENQIKFIDDPSNLNLKYDRNYIRNRVWPVIEERFDIADINAIKSIQHLNEAWELTCILADLDIKNVRLTDGTLDWEQIKNLGYLRIKNLIMRILDLENVYSFSIGHIEQFAQGLIDADMDSKNELYLKGFKMKKIGKRIFIECQPNIKVAA